MILKSLEINTDRVALKWASAAEGPLFVKLITEFTGKIKDIGTLGSGEGLNREEGMKVRMAFAKQAKQIKKDKAYGHLPSEEKLLTVLMNEMARYEKS